MELSIIRRETTGSPPNQYNESETITKFEIMDGAPVRGNHVLFSTPTSLRSDVSW
jgi:vacuolar protein sorting-associated protein 26